MPLYFFVPTAFTFSLHSGLFSRGISDNSRQVTTPASSELAIVAGVQFLLFSAEGAAPNYYVGTLWFAHVGPGMLFPLQTLLVNIVSHFGFYRFAERMCMYLVLVAMAFQRVSEVNWPSCGGSDDFLSYDFSTVTVPGYPAEGFASIKRQKVGDGPMVPALTPADDVNWPPCVAHNMIYELERDCRR